jgi:hypothetical protein
MAFGFKWNTSQCYINVLPWLWWPESPPSSVGVERPPRRRPRPNPADMLHEAVHALAHARGVKDTSRGGKYHNKREFVAPRRRTRPGLAPRPAAPFGDRLLRGPADRADLADYADTLADLGAAIRLYRDTFRRLACSAAQAKIRSRRVRTATGSPPGGPASGSRLPAAASRPGHSGSGPSSTRPG